VPLDLAIGLFRVTPHGGLERQALALAQEAARRAHRVRLYTRTLTGELPAGVEPHVLPVRAWTNLGRDQAFDHAFSAALRAHPAEVVLGYNRLSALDVFYAADPCHAATRGRPGRLPLPARRARNASERELFRADGHVHALVQSERERARYVEAYGTPAERLHLLPPGLRPEFLVAPRPREPGLRAELGLPADAVVVLAVGSDFRRKGLDRTLDALAGRAFTALLVVGAGRVESFARRARALGVRTSFLGGRTDVLDCYRAADVFVHPAREENTGSVLLEAASQGLPVVASGACGFAPLIAAAGAGVVLDEPFRVRELRAALDLLLADPARRAALGARGRAVAAGWPMSRRIEVILSCLERAASEKRRAGARP